MLSTRQLEIWEHMDYLPAQHSVLKSQIDGYKGVSDVYIHVFQNV